MGKKSRMTQECHAGVGSQKDVQPSGNALKSLDQKVLVLVAGLPYSGKTTFAKYLSQTKQYPLLEGDSLDANFQSSINENEEGKNAIQYLRSRYTEDEVSMWLEKIVADAYVRNIVNTLGSHNGVIIESARFGMPQIPDYRGYIIQMVRPQVDIATEAYWMDTDLGTILSRYRAHNQKPKLWTPNMSEKEKLIEDQREFLTEDELRIRHANVVLPKLEEGFNKIFYVTAISLGQYVIKEQTVRQNSA